MSKHAGLGLVRLASLHLVKYGIRVNCVSPGPVAMPLMEETFGKGREETGRQYEKFFNLKNTGALKVNHVADAVVFLASKEAEFITGHNLVVDSGFRSATINE